MKKHLKTIVLMVLAIIPLTLSAQEKEKKTRDAYNKSWAITNLDTEFKNFMSNKDISEYANGSSARRSDKDDKISSLMESNTFKIPSDKQKYLEQLSKAFKYSKPEAYYFFTQEAGLSSQKITNIAYGENLEYKHGYGGYFNRNYSIACIKDPADSLKRYCYAMTWWYEEPARSEIHVKLDKFYSYIPEEWEKMQEKNGNHIVISNNNEIGNLSKKELRQLKKLLGNGYNITISNNSSSQKTDTITSSSEFLLRFGNLKNMYNKNQQEEGMTETTISTVLANKILELCNNYGHILSASEKNICIETLKDMNKYTPDKFIKGIFNEAIKKLG